MSIQSDMEDLMSKAVNQNFVPVVDDKDIFIGIITRKDIIQYLDRQRRQADAGENRQGVGAGRCGCKNRAGLGSRGLDENGNAQELTI